MGFNPMFRVLKIILKSYKKIQLYKNSINENKLTPFCQFNVSYCYIPIENKIKIVHFLQWHQRPKNNEQTMPLPKNGYYMKRKVSDTKMFSGSRISQMWQNIK